MTAEEVQQAFVSTIRKATAFEPMDGEVPKNGPWKEMGQGVSRLVVNDSMSFVRATLRVTLDDHPRLQQQIQIQINSLVIIFASLAPRGGKVRLKFSEPQVRDEGPVKHVTCSLEGVLE